MTTADKTSPFDVVDRIGDVAVFRDGPKPRGPADRHGALDVDVERVAVFVQTGPAWPIPEVLARGRALLPLRDRNVARAFFFDAVRNKYHWIIERPGGVSLPALVRRVRKRAGALPPVTCARIVRDLVRAQGLVDQHAPRERTYLFGTTYDHAAIAADCVVAWDGHVVLAPRMFGTPPDAPPWLHRRSLVELAGALLLALLTPELAGADVDAAILRLLQENAALRGTGVDALEMLTARALGAPASPQRRARAPTPPTPRTPPTPPTPLSPMDLADELDEIVRALGGDDESFAASLMSELFPERKRVDLAWREEMTAVALAASS